MALTKTHNRMIEGDVRNPRDFGAIGDGITDDTAALNAALAGGNICLRLVAGDTYLVTDEVNINSNTILDGNGAAIKYLAGTIAPLKYGLIVSQKENVIIQNLEIDGNKSAYAPVDFFGVYVRNSDNVTIKNCTIHNCWRAGIHGGQVALGQSTNCFYLNNYIYNIGDATETTQYGNGIALVHDKYVVIEGNIIENIYGTGGINLEGDTYSDITIRGNHIKAGTGSNLRGIMMYETGAEVHDNIIVESNIVEDQLGAGISFVGDGDRIISNNIVKGCGEEGIKCITSANSNITITGNSVFDCGDLGFAGINVSQSSRLVVTNNIVAECPSNSTVGYSLRCSEGGVISGNIANGVQTNAFELACNGFVFTDNTSNNIGGVGSGSNYFLKNITGSVCTDGYVGGNVLNNTSGTATAFWLINGSNFVDIECGLNRSNVTKYSFSSASGCKINNIIGPNAPDLGSVFGNSAAWETGDIVYDATPSASGQIGWVCVSGGTPGTWKAFGSISA